jgi:hypothetical protein
MHFMENPIFGDNFTLQFVEKWLRNIIKIWACAAFRVGREPDNLNAHRDHMQLKASDVHFGIDCSPNRFSPATKVRIFASFA